MKTIKNANMWSSIIFHCASTDARLLCAELSTTDTAACSTVFETFTPVPTVAPSPAPTIPSSEKYCATFRSNQAADANGYFAMEISNGIAKYAYNIDLTKFALSSSCSTLSSSGLKFHLHSYWKNSSSSSSAGSTYCGKSLTGGHYDPTLACGASSESSSTGCTYLGRTSSKGYTYSCNSTVYGSGDYAAW
jgi:hypothetical protein